MRAGMGESENSKSKLIRSSNKKTNFNLKLREKYYKTGRVSMNVVNDCITQMCKYIFICQ